MSGEDSSAVGIGLALEDDPVARSLKSEVDPSDPAEEAADIHAAPRYAEGQSLLRADSIEP